jgi:hypothetical protein
VQDDDPTDEDRGAPEHRRRLDALTRALGDGDLARGLHDSEELMLGVTSAPLSPARPPSLRAPSRAYRSPARQRQAAPIRGRVSRRQVARAGASWRARLDNADRGRQS